MKAHTIIKNHSFEEYIVFHNGDEFKINKYKNIKGIPDNKSFFVYKKIGYKTYEGFTPYKYNTLREAKKGIKNRSILK